MIDMIWKDTVTQLINNLVLKDESTVPLALLEFSFIDSVWNEFFVISEVEIKRVKTNKM